MIRWYASLCPKAFEREEHGAGPSKISTLMRITPKLLRLTWDGFPLHYSDKYGWGYVVPGRKEGEEEQIETGQDGNSLSEYPVE